MILIKFNNKFKTGPICFLWSYVCEERTSLHWEGWLIFDPFLEIKPKTSVSNSLAWIIMNIILHPSCLYPGTYSQLTESGILGNMTELNHADWPHPAI